MKPKHLLWLLPVFCLMACGEPKPVQAKLNVDNCDYCRMGIADAKFVAELITAKGRIYMFDDVVCLQNYCKENKTGKEAKLFVANFNKPDQFLPVAYAVFVKGDQISSPMGGNLAAFDNNKAAEIFSATRAAQILTWSDLRN